jgi:hypothetical protein
VGKRSFKSSVLLTFLKIKSTFSAGCYDRSEEVAGLRIHERGAQNLGRHFAGIQAKTKT